MSKDIRSFLEQVEKLASGEVIRIKEVIDPTRFEATAIMEKVFQRRRSPALIFERPKNLKGEIASARVLLNLLGSHRRAEIMFNLEDVPRMELVREYMERENNPIDPLVISPSDAPVKEMVFAGAKLDLRELPILRHFEMDGNPYIDTAVITNDRDYGYNASFLRMMYLDRNHTAIHMSPRHQWTYFQKREEKGESLPIAVVLGHHPAFYTGSLTLAPISADEYKIIGGMLKEPLRVVPSEAFGSDLLVPADAEIIVEGEIVPQQRVVEGPFSEWPGYYGPQRLRWVVEVKAITCRRDPYYFCSMSGWLVESNNLGLATEAGLYSAVARVAPTVNAVACVGRGFRFNVYISIKKRMEGEPVSAALAALAASDYVKNVIVVDEDINPWSLPDVMWAVSTRVQPERDVTIIKNKKGSTLDPSTGHEVATSAMIIDATVPLDQPYERTINIPPWVADRIKLADYISEDELNRASYETTLF